MRNKLIFENKRDHIVDIVHAAIRDERVWNEAMELNKSTSCVEQKAHLNPTTTTLRQQSQYYCIVDASWKSPTEKAGIGWSLISKEDISYLQGSSAIAPTNSPFIAETMAMLLAVQQLHTLAYTDVAILGDCMELIKCLEAMVEERPKDKIQINEAHSILQDIAYLARINKFTFYYVPRNQVYVVDQLAKRARITNKNYVIFWRNC